MDFYKCKISNNITIYFDYHSRQALKLQYKKVRLNNYIFLEISELHNINNTKSQQYLELQTIQ